MSAIHFYKSCFSTKKEIEEKKMKPLTRLLLRGFHNKHNEIKNKFVSNCTIVFKNFDNSVGRILFFAIISM